MLLSKSCEYAVRATIYIAKKSNNGERSGIIEISKEIDSPQHFTAKILQTLVRAGVISSLKGPAGGFYLDTGKNIALIDIVRAIDGDQLFTSCALGLKKCSESKPCPMHHQVIPIRSQLMKVFSETSVAELMEGFDLNLYFLK